MTIMKHTIFFRQGDRGWSESYWRDNPSHAEGLTQALALMNQRLRLMPGDCEIHAIRVSQPGLPRDSLLERPLTVTGTIPRGIYPADPSTAVVNQATDAFVVELIAAADRKNRIYLRGIPDTLINSGVFVGDPAWAARFNGPAPSFESLLVTNNWLVRVKSPVAGAFLTQPISSIRGTILTSRKTGRPFGLHPGRRGRRAAA